MIERVLGSGGLRVSAIGLGCMGMSEFYDPKRMDDSESIRVIHCYLDVGGNFLDTADMYGVGRNEELVGQAIRGRRDQVVLATKFGNVRGPNGEFLGPAATRRTSATAATRASGGWASTPSTCTTSTGSTRTRRSRRRSGRWPSW
jgi:aryl-alcohol dehydrogenase-like predicted oxidoreductase